MEIFSRYIVLYHGKILHLSTLLYFLKVIEIYDIFNLSKRERGEMKTFSDKAYDLLRNVPKGRVTTYKEIAHALETRAYRGVGQAMKRNPYAPEVP